MKYLACILGGFILGSSTLWAQGFAGGSSFLDSGAAKPQDRAAIQQWWVEKEIRAGNSPYGNNPYAPRPCN